MNAVLVSIKPKWVEKILNGEKTIEIRKTMPKCELPCKVYIYCTKDKDNLLYGNSYVDRSWKLWEDKTLIKDIVLVKGWDAKTGDVFDCCLANGKVVAEFTLNTIEKYGWVHAPLLFIDGYMRVSENNLPEKGLNYNACCITKKEIADYADDGGILPAPVFAWHIDDLKIYDKPKELSDFGLKRPPQSWCYVEEVNDGTKNKI